MVFPMRQPSFELSRAEIEEILHHAHWIASKNGAQGRFMREKYPSFTFDQLIKVLVDKKCIVRSHSRNGESAHFSGWRVRRGLKNIEISME